MLLEVLGGPGAAWRSEAWPLESPGCPGGCPENIPPIGAAISGMARKRRRAAAQAGARGARDGPSHVTLRASAGVLGAPGKLHV